MKKKAFLPVAAVFASLGLLLFATGCSHTESTTALQREQDRYWNAVTDNLTFNRGTPRLGTVVEVRTTRTTTTTQRVRTVTDK